MTKNLLITVLLFTLLSALLSSCDNAKINVYETDKDLRPQISRGNSLNTLGGRGSKLTWTAPLSWKKLDGTALSKNRYESENEQGRVIISVSAVPRAATIARQTPSLLAKQLGLPAINPQELSSITTHRTYSNLDATEIFLSNAEQNLSAKNVSFPLYDRIWNFTMKGNIEAVAAEDQRFTSLLESLQSINAEEIQESNDTVSTLHETINITPPDGWIENDPNPLRVASYTVERIGLNPADFAVLRFDKSEGNALSNINRWRRQIGIPNWTEQKLEQRTRTLNTETLTFKTFDLKAETAGEKENTSERIFIGILDYGENIYYFKLQGDALLLETQRKNFIATLSSVSITSIQRPNARPR